MGALTAIGMFEVLNDNEGQWFGPRELPDDKIRKFVELAEGSGLVVHCDGHCDHTLILDLHEGNGVADDRCIVSEQAWAQLNSELELVAR